jgi:hypothetical protein
MVSVPIGPPPTSLVQLAASEVMHTSPSMPGEKRERWATSFIMSSANQYASWR